jgi:hypothetical protein
MGMNENKTHHTTWIDRLEARGMGGMMRLLVDIATPFSIIGAQVLWILQPIATLWGKGTAMGELAKWLENPDAMRDLRARLDTRHSSDDQPIGD